MELAFSLLSRKTLHFAPHHKLKMYIKQGDALIEKSVGEDFFDYNGALLPDTPVVATGRIARHTMQPDLTAFQGVAATPVNIPGSRDKSWDQVLANLTLWLDNNVILSQGDLQTYYGLVAAVDGRQIPISLHTPLMKVSWEGKGLFRIDLAGTGIREL